MGSLGERIKRVRLDAGFENQAEFARKLGVTRQAVSAWETGISEPSTKQLRHVSILTKASFDYLATGRGTPVEQHGIEVMCILEAGAWREGHTLRQKLDGTKVVSARYVPALTGPEYAGMCQFGAAMADSSANLTLQMGDHAMCVQFKDFRPHGPHPGDFVVLEKYRGKEHKTFAARMFLAKGRWEAHLESDDPYWQNQPPIQFDEDLTCDENDHTQIAIIGCIMAKIRFDLAPPIRLTTAKTL